MYRKFILFTILFYCTTTSYSQDWFPIGATWYYNQVSFLPPGNNFREFEVTGETVIQGKNCKIITGLCQCGEFGSINYLYQDGDRIYMYDPGQDLFWVLYDFTLTPGDTLQYHSTIAGDTYFILDSISYIQAGPLNLRVQHLHSIEGGLQLGNNVYERMGSDGCLYPIIGFCDPGTSGLRCYEDSIIGLQKFIPVELACDYISSTKELDTDPSLSVYPNPTDGMLFIDSKTSIKQLELMEMQSGIVLIQSDCHDTHCLLDTQFLSGGAYILRIKMEDGRLITRKVVII